MYTYKKVTSLAVLAASCFLFSCANDEDQPSPDNSLIPENFSVNIPSSISNDNAPANGRVVFNGRVQEGELKGDDIYRHLTHFIRIGEGSAEIVESVMRAIRVHNIDKPMSLTIESEEDGRVKNLVVTENASFEGHSWAYEMLITDAESESNADGGKALQIFWNVAPVKGIAILKPYNIDRAKHDALVENMVYRIDYSEGGEQNYDAQMLVQISGLPLDTNNPFSVDNLKMFVGRKGDIVDVFGNSNHPQAKLYTDNVGYSWAFVASANDTEDYGLAEVGLPFNTIDSPSRLVTLEEYSMHAVFQREIQAAYPNLTEEQVDYYLQNTQAPGYFNKETGFIAAGESPDEKYSTLLARIADMSPFSPKEVQELSISFK